MATMATMEVTAKEAATTPRPQKVNRNKRPRISVSEMIDTDSETPMKEVIVATFGDADDAANTPESKRKSKIPKTDSAERKPPRAHEPSSSGGQTSDVASAADPDAHTPLQLPQKKFYRQRAHSNPLADHAFEGPLTPDLMDWSEIYPAFFKAVHATASASADTDQKQVEFLDIGCGYGGMLVELSTMFPETISLGLEIRVKVSDYVRDRILALRSQQPRQYDNIGVIRTNAMKYLPNYFKKAQLKKLFFLYPDPHFKKQKWKWRVISQTLLAEYAYVTAVGGIVYTITDVVDVHEWMVDHLNRHPLFERLTQDEVAADVIVPKLYESTEEGRKVYRNKASAQAGTGKNHGDGDVRVALFRRIAAPA